MTMKFSKDGVLLADVVGSGVAKVDPNARSGNPRHDTRSGKFGSGGGGGDKRPGANPPGQTDPMEWKRMLDAAREAAREFDTPQEGDIREFLAGRARNPDQVDVAGFLAQVIEEKKNDLVDALDQQMRQGGPLQRGRRRVGIRVPRNYLRRLIGGMGEDDLAEVMARLEAMGHQREDVDQWFSGRVKKPETHEAAKPKRDALAASDQYEWTKFADLANSWEGWDRQGYVTADDADEEYFENALAMVEAVAKHLPQPQVTLQPVINVEIPKPGATKNTPVRDDNGMILHTISEPVDAD